MAKKIITEQAKSLHSALVNEGIEAELEHWDGHKHVDICIPGSKIYIEVDGVQHFTNPDQMARDFIRDHYSDEDGFNTLHIPNSVIENDLKKVVRAIRKVVIKMNEDDAKDADFIKKAIELSKESVVVGGYPVGAVIVQNGKIISTGLSDGKQLCDPTSHAETAAIREAGKKLNKRDLDDVVLYSSLEPCVMCFASSFWAYIPKVVYACSREKVSSDYYEGEHNIHELNETGRRKTELVHFNSLEEEALSVITKWEKNN